MKDREALGEEEMKFLQEIEIGPHAVTNLLSVNDEMILQVGGRGLLIEKHHQADSETERHAATNFPSANDETVPQVEGPGLAIKDHHQADLKTKRGQHTM